MILFGLVLLAGYGSAGILEQLDKSIYCTPSKDPHQYNVGLAFAAPYKGTNAYDVLPAADGTTYVATHVEIYDNTCNAPVFTNDVSWSDINSTVFHIDKKTRISVNFPIYPAWRRYGKKCWSNRGLGKTTGPGSVYWNGQTWGSPTLMEAHCEDYESLYQCDHESLDDDSFCSVKLGNLTLQTDVDGAGSRVQYSRVFKYARTNVGDACNCWQEVDGYNFVFACGCAVNTDLGVQGLPGLTPPNMDIVQNYILVEALPKVDPGSLIIAEHRTIVGPLPFPGRHSTTSKHDTTSTFKNLSTIKRTSTTKSTSTTKKTPTTEKTSTTKSTSNSKDTSTTKRVSNSKDTSTTTKGVSTTKSHSVASHTTVSSSTQKPTTKTTMKTTPRTSSHISTTATVTYCSRIGNPTGPAELCVWKTATEKQ